MNPFKNRDILGLILKKLECIDYFRLSQVNKFCHKVCKQHLITITLHLERKKKTFIYTAIPKISNTIQWKINNNIQRAFNTKKLAFGWTCLNGITIEREGIESKIWHKHLFKNGIYLKRFTSVKGKAVFSMTKGWKILKNTIYI